MKKAVSGIVLYIAHLSTEYHLIFAGTLRVMFLVVNINLGYRLTSERLLCLRHQPGEVGYLFHRSPSSSTYSYPASPSSLAVSELRQTWMVRYVIQLRVFDGGRLRINGQRAHWSVYTFIALK